MSIGKTVAALTALGSLFAMGYGGVTTLNEWHADRLDTLDQYLELQSKIKASDSDHAAQMQSFYENIGDTRQLLPVEERYKDYWAEQAALKRQEVSALEKERRALKGK